MSWLIRKVFQAMGQGGSTFKEYEANNFYSGSEWIGNITPNSSNRLITNVQFISLTRYHVGHLSSIRKNSYVKLMVIALGNLSLTLNSYSYPAVYPHTSPSSPSLETSTYRGQIVAGLNTAGERSVLDRRLRPVQVQEADVLAARLRHVDRHQEADVDRLHG